MKNKKDYDYFLQKARSELILQREEAILIELRATREYLEQTIEQGLKNISCKLEKQFDKKGD